MDGITIFLLLSPLFIFIICLIVIVMIVSRNEGYRENMFKVTEGMNVDEVVAIMGSPSYTKKHQDGSYEYIYEKSEWKGYIRGGTRTRRMEVVFSSNGIVISIGRNENCNMSGW